MRTIVPTVESVRGRVEVSKLGCTLMHEHVFLLDPEALQNFGHAWGESYWDEELEVERATVKLRRLVDNGIRTIVDATVLGLGRNIPLIQRVNANVPELQIIVATGVYAYAELPLFLATRSDEALTGLFVREIHDGIDNTGVRAAFLKFAVERGLTGDVPRILAAIAAASVQTGAPIMVHTDSAAKTGAVALDALVRAGVDPSKVVITHAGDSNDLDYLRGMADKGAWLGCDRFSLEAFNPDASRVQTIATLVSEGYTDRIHLSHDVACFVDFMTHNPAFIGQPEPDYLHISHRIVPALLEAGVTQDEVDQMMIQNPQRFFS
jgi:phosphotriesterase-related protein